MKGVEVMVWTPGSGWASLEPDMCMHGIATSRECLLAQAYFVEFIR